MKNKKNNEKILFTPLKKGTEPHQSFTGSYKKKLRGTGWTPRYTEY